MKAIVYGGEGRVELGDVPEPSDPGASGAIVRPTVMAICGSDLHVVEGRIPGVGPGDVLGHECVGIVESVGSSVTRIQPGDRVVTSFLIACGRCWFCERREHNLCEDARVLGYGMLFGNLAGAQAELVCVPDADVNLRRVPDALDDEGALFAGDILSTAWAATRTVQPGDSVAIIGAGPLGQLVALCARLQGAGRVLAVDLVAQRLVSIQADGVDASRTNPVVAVQNATCGRGADIAVDAAGGSVQTLLTAMDLTRRGGRVLVAGVHSELEMTFPLAETWLRAQDIRFLGTANVQRWWGEVLDAVASGHIDPRAIISHRLALADGVRGYELFASKEAQKVVLLA